MNSVTLHGHVMSYLDVGSTDKGNPIVFVHGLMSSSATWTAQADRLAAGHRVIAPDLFGHGSSDKPAGDYSLSAHAASLRDLFDTVGVTGATLVGHSLGGGIALQMAYLFPDRVDALVLVSSGGLGRELNPLLRAATLPGSELVLPVVASGWLHTVGDTALRVWSRVGLPAISPSSDEAWHSLQSLADGETRRAFLATSRSVIDVGGQTVSAQNRLAGFASRPSMLIWGERDRMIPAAHVQNAQRELPATRVEMFPRSGHFPHADEPDRFARVLDEFIAANVIDMPEPPVTAGRQPPARPGGRATRTTPRRPAGRSPR
jgi:pimeloyl-ACP methyl ester carboxylesterase